MPSKLSYQPPRRCGRVGVLRVRPPAIYPSAGSDARYASGCAARRPRPQPATATLRPPAGSRTRPSARGGGGDLGGDNRLRALDKGPRAARAESGGDDEGDGMSAPALAGGGVEGGLAGSGKAPALGASWGLCTTLTAFSTGGDGLCRLTQFPGWREIAQRDAQNTGLASPPAAGMPSTWPIT